MAAGSASGAATAATRIDSGTGIESTTPVTRHEEIALLAYSYWQARGCPNGSPEEDWFRAEDELREQTS